MTETTLDAAKTAPKWETVARERVRAAVRRYQKPLAELISRDANEGDTRLLVTDFLCDALGYDKYEDLTTEYQVKGEFADYGVRIDKQLIAFIEVKRCTQALGEKHLRQVQSYAVNEGVEWMILTNGRVWQMWHMTPGLPVVMDKVLDIDLLDESKPSERADLIFYLTREAMKRHLIDDLWRLRAATSGKSLAAVIMSDPILEQIRKELWRKTGYKSPVEDLRAALKSSVLRADVV